MGCGSSVRAEAVDDTPKPKPEAPPAASEDEIAAGLAEDLEQVEQGADEAAEFLTLGASEGQIHTHYIIGQRIGGGNFAQVYKCKHVQTKKQYAVKILGLGTDAKKSMRAKAPLLSMPKKAGSSVRLLSSRSDIPWAAGRSEATALLHSNSIVQPQLSPSSVLHTDPRNSAHVGTAGSGHSFGGPLPTAGSNPSQLFNLGSPPTSPAGAPAGRAPSLPGNSGSRTSAAAPTPAGAGSAAVAFATASSLPSPVSGARGTRTRRSVSIDGAQSKEPSIREDASAWEDSFAIDSLDTTGPRPVPLGPPPEELKMICREVGILRSIEHPSIVRFYEYFLSPKRNRVFVVLELLEGGDLMGAISKRRGNIFTEADAAKVFLPVLRGLEYLHGRGIVHRDMKLDNLLLADENDLGSAKIADFGMARHAVDARRGKGGAGAVAPEDPLTRTLCGTPAYMAPELLHPDTQGNTTASDMWSAGVILHVLLTGTMPFIDDNVERLYEKIRRAELDMTSKIWEGVSDLAQSLVFGLMNPDPAARLTASDAVSHEWIRGAGSWLACAPETAAKVKLREHILKTWAGDAAQQTSLRDRDYIMRQGEPSPFVFFVQKGIVELFVEANLLGDEAKGAVTSVVPLGRCAAGEYVGELTMVDPRLVAERVAHPGTHRGAALRLCDPEGDPPPCPVSVRASGDAQLICIKTAELREHVDANPAAKTALLDEAQKRLEWLEGRLEKARAWRNGLFVQDANGRYRRALITFADAKKKRGTVTGAGDFPEAGAPAFSRTEVQGGSVGGAGAGVGRGFGGAAARSERERFTRSLDVRLHQPLPQPSRSGRASVGAIPASLGSTGSALKGPPTVIYEGRESVAIRGEMSKAWESRTFDQGSPLSGSEASPPPPWGPPAAASARGHLGRMRPTAPEGGGGAIQASAGGSEGGAVAAVAADLARSSAAAAGGAGAAPQPKAPPRRASSLSNAEAVED